MQDTVITIKIITVVTILILLPIKFASSSVASRTLTSTDLHNNPKYPANIHDWFGREINKNITCIKFHAALQIEVNVDEDVMWESVPLTALSEGSCDELQQYIELSWTSDKDPLLQFFLTLFFEKEVKNLTEFKYVLHAVHIEWNRGNGSFINGTSKRTMENLTSFETFIGHSFKCSGELTIIQDFGIYFYDLQFQAFYVFNDTATNFGEEDTCPEDYKLIDMGKRLFSMISLLLGCVLILFFLSWILQQILRRQCPIQFGYHNVN